ncbi:MAG TPA: hypothetical protein DDW85_04335 [Porphyromonadaceae bacterium]|nr:hypothetical protein [Porphyromonadaceae bacterium]
MNKRIYHSRKDESLLFSKNEDQSFLENRNLYELLNKNQQILLDAFYRKQVKTLSVRCQNVLHTYSMDDFCRMAICRPGFSFLSLRKIGIESAKQLEGFKKEMVDEIHRINTLKNEEILLENVIIEYEYNGDETIIISFLHKNGYIPMFLLLENRLNSILSSKDRNIMRQWFEMKGVYENNLPEVSIQKEYLTRKKVEKIEESVLRSFFDLDSPFFSHKQDWEYYNYLLCKTDIITPESISLKNCLLKERSHLWPVFAIHALAVIFHSQLTLFGGIESSLPPNRTWRSAYLIHRELSESFLFQQFKNEFLKDVKQIKRNSATEIDLSKYLFRPSLCKKAGKHFSERVLKILGFIVKYEFGYEVKEGRYVPILTTNEPASSN